MKRKTLNKKLRAAFTKHAVKHGIKTHPQLENLLRRANGSTRKMTNKEALDCVLNSLGVTL